MARCPFAVWKPLPQNTNQQNDNDDIQVIFHSLTSPSALSSWDYFAGKNAAGTEPHFLIEYDGTIIQSMDTAARADANWSANTHAVSFETASNHGATDPWTPQQLASLKRASQWLLTVHPSIGRRVCRTNTDPGFGYHRLFHEWNLSNHSCPGNARVAQFGPLVTSILAPSQPAHPNGVPLVATAEEEASIAAQAAKSVMAFPIHTATGDVSFIQWIANLGRNVEELQAQVTALTPKAGI